ncbi:aryldialkylphosphatase [Arthrobacter crystallopoietes]|uniref:Phosphotriesterase-related protein n=1 Tax=Crystallibacter crystallopoietes TaxID=37928 RepID=A0A1H1D599_9MICC|nr:aryldialkylphosphatase [Arthrobacter crystallopoietes]AUI50454.1 aryldialkylphosphatase [Arthrobacter crystallopoietes]SDQ71633.1 phosphotriesterase-related protein [Arthrobacter crystallopoietes]
MTDTTTPTNTTVNTVLGPVPADELGVVSVHEALLSVVPGAEHAYDISMDRAEIFEILAAKLTDFRENGGKTIVDSTGMFHGRDVRLYEALSRSTGVHIVASTGMGPEEMLGGYFLTPQTNPPTPWPAEKFADLFTKEVTEGMVVPRVERRGAAGIVTTTATREGMTPTDESLFRGAARTALNTGVPVSIRFGKDALGDLGVVLEEQLPADRVVVGGLDRKDAAAAGVPFEVAEGGAFVALDHVGLNDDDAYLTDRERASLVLELVKAGHGDRILLSSSAVGVAKGHADYDLPFSYVISTFMPFVKSLGLADDDARRILVDNPRDLLTLR